jgi:hypothetical protein
MMTQGLRPAAAWLLPSQTHLAERDLDGLQAFSLDVVRKVQQKMEKESVVFVLLERSMTEIYANPCGNKTFQHMIRITTPVTHYTPWYSLVCIWYASLVTHDTHLVCIFYAWDTHLVIIWYS